MGDRHRAARLDLGLELRHHRSVGRQHVAEAHRNKPHPRLAIGLGGEVMIERLAIHLGEPLGQTQHRHRLDRLVGRDHHHRACARRQCRIGDIHRSENIGLDAFAPVAFENRHMLEGRGVKDDIRLEFAHQPQDALAIADIRHPPLDHRAGLVRRQRLGDRIERRFRILDHQQSRGTECHDRSQISEPIEPPPPVTMTALSFTRASRRA